MKYLIIFLLLFLPWFRAYPKDGDTIQYDPTTHKRIPNYSYSYIDREHTTSESAKHVAAIYGITWVLYPLTQPDVVREKGSWDRYQDNFGKIVFDKDERIWNWVVHPLSGSQLFLYYRANGYSRVDSLTMAFISSTLFEFTVEIYTEPASVQDLYQTPIFGSMLGVGLESLSMYLLNTGNIVAQFFGHLINPMTLFWFYEGKVKITPEYRGDKNGRVTLTIDF